MRQIHHNWLIADIGATSSRCAICCDGEITEIHAYRNQDQLGVAELLTAFMANVPEKPTACALAVAAPIDGDRVAMVNRNWGFDKASIQALGLERVEILNDFHAIAFALPGFSDDTRIEIGRATQYRDGNIAVLGPGSGLGMAAWISGQSAMCGEGGHISISGRDAHEDRIIAALRERFDHASAERVLSGPGLMALHEAMHGDKPASSEAITSAPEEKRNRETLDQFFLFLGSVAAERALSTGAYGGVSSAGGIVPAIVDVAQASGFRERFENKNRYRDYMRAIPTWIITDPYPGLTGLQAWITQGCRRP